MVLMLACDVIVNTGELYTYRPPEDNLLLIPSAKTQGPARLLRAQRLQGMRPPLSS